MDEIIAVQGTPGLIPDRGTKIHMPWSNYAYAPQLLSPHTATRESVHHNERSHVLPLRPDSKKRANVRFATLSFTAASVEEGIEMGAVSIHRDSDEHRNSMSEIKDLWG